jgi:hypothetical protein
MDKQATIGWLKTAAITAVGGGIAGIFSAVMDPSKYSFPADLGSGKMWKYCFMGAVLTLGGLLLKSPLGQRAVSAFKDSQQLLKDSKEAISAAQADLKSAAQALPQEESESLSRQAAPSSPAGPSPPSASAKK